MEQCGRNALAGIRCFQSHSRAHPHPRAHPHVVMPLRAFVVFRERCLPIVPQLAAGRRNALAGIRCFQSSHLPATPESAQPYQGRNALAGIRCFQSPEGCGSEMVMYVIVS